MDNLLISMSQVNLINSANDRALPGSRPYSLSHVSDPSDEVVAVLIELLDRLKSNLPV